jgi:sugar lactone lactonase YvrE
MTGSSQGGASSQFQAPGEVAVDGQGQVCVSDDKGIQIFAPDGRYLSVIRLPDLALVFEMAFDQLGALYAVANNGKVYKILLAPPSK